MTLTISIQCFQCVDNKFEISAHIKCFFVDLPRLLYKCFCFNALGMPMLEINCRYVAHIVFTKELYAYHQAFALPSVGVSACVCVFVCVRVCCLLAKGVC